jgi:hypothetical protein
MLWNDNKGNPERAEITLHFEWDPDSAKTLPPWVNISPDQRFLCPKILVLHTVWS